MDKTEFRKGASRRSLILLVVATVLGLIHHADHVLRVDHSGWPFQADVSPFTYSLLVYPIVLFVFLARSRPLLGAGTLALTLVALQAAHVSRKRRPINTGCGRTTPAANPTRWDSPTSWG